MTRLEKAFGAKKVRLGISLGCAVTALLLAGAVAIGDDDDDDVSPHSPSRQDHGIGHSQEGGGLSQDPTVGRVHRPDALRCTGPEEPVNFEVFSAGPSPAGLPLTGSSRRCNPPVPGEKWPANYVSYSYGDCEIPEGASACQPPLVIQTWPACQRSIADYSFEGKPLPSRKLPKHGGAEVVEFDFAIERRIEVYTKSATVVIFATDPELARKAVGLLRPHEKGKPPATDADALGGSPPAGLEPPTEGSMKGVLPCQS